MLTREEALRRLDAVANELGALRAALAEGWTETSDEAPTQAFLAKCGAGRIPGAPRRSSPRSLRLGLSPTAAQPSFLRRPRESHVVLPLGHRARSWSSSTPSCDVGTWGTTTYGLA